jgi:hypothetical protein
LVVDITDTFVTQIQGENGSAYFEASGQIPAVKNLAGQDLIWEITQYSADNPTIPLTFGPFTATPVVPAEGTDDTASLNITKDTTSGGNYIIEVVLKDALGEAGAGSLSTIVSACTFNVEIDVPCVNGQQVIVLTGTTQGQVIDAIAFFGGVISGSYSDGDQLLSLLNVQIVNPTANIYSFCTQEADGNIQAGDVGFSGLNRSSGVQYWDGVWSAPNYIQYYKTGGGGTGEIKMRPLPNQENAIDWSTVPEGAPLRFTSGKKQISFINQVGTVCTAIFNHTSIFSFYRAPGAPIEITGPPGDNSISVCYVMGFETCATPLCPVAGELGLAPYAVPSGFQPSGSGGGGNSCGGGPAQPYGCG